jgi:hypothetical protein
MSVPRVGSYVTHAKLPELGSGEITSISEARISIRFESGERSFVYDLVEKHLHVTSEAPPQKPTKAHKPRASKSTSKSTTRA